MLIDLKELKPGTLWIVKRLDDDLPNKHIVMYLNSSDYNLKVGDCILIIKHSIGWNDKTSEYEHEINILANGEYGSLFVEDFDDRIYELLK